MVKSRKTILYLASTEWVVRAEHSDQTVEAHQEWVEEVPWIPDVDSVSRDQIQTVEWLLSEDPNARPDPPPSD